MRILDALIDSGSAFSMLSIAMYGRLPHAPAIQPFTCAAPDVIGVECASAEIRGYVDGLLKSLESRYTIRCLWWRDLRFCFS